LLSPEGYAASPITRLANSGLSLTTPSYPNGEIRRMRFEKRKRRPVPPLATLSPMIRVAITAAAYHAIRSTLPVYSHLWPVSTL
jgi:hypothetical protein